MNEKLNIINNNIAPFNKNKNINDIYTNYIDYESSKSNNSISLDYSTKEKDKEDKEQNSNFENIDVNNLESIRLSLILGNKDLNPQILLDRIKGIKRPEKNSKKKKSIKKIHYIRKMLVENEHEINVINAINSNKGLEIDNNNNKNIMVESEEHNSEENYSLNIEEYDKRDSEKFNIKNNYNNNYEKSENEKRKEDEMLYKKQNVLLVQLLDNNDSSHKNNKKNIIISNLYEDLNVVTDNTKTKKTKSNGLKNDTPKKPKSKIYEKKYKNIKKENMALNLSKNDSFKNMNIKNMANMSSSKYLTKNKLKNLKMLIQEKKVINKTFINNNFKKLSFQLKMHNSNSTFNSIKHKFTKHIDKINDNIIKKYKTKIYSSKEKDKNKEKYIEKECNNNYYKRINNSHKKNSVNEHHNLLKLVQLKRNKSVRSTFASNKSYITIRNENKNISHHINNNSKNQNGMNIYKLKNNIPIDNKKNKNIIRNSNRNLSKRIYTESNNQNSLNPINSFIKLKINSNKKLISQMNNKKLKLNINQILNECNKILLNSKIATKNSSFNINRNLNNKMIRKYRTNYSGKNIFKTNNNTKRKK
jgi:hypothetical protein